MTPVGAARAIQKGKTVDAASLRALADAFIAEREKPRLKPSDFYAGRLKWAPCDPEYDKRYTYICQSELRTWDIWLDHVEGGYQLIYQDGGAGCMRYYDVFASIEEAETFLIVEHLGYKLERYPVKVRQFVQGA